MTKERPQTGLEALQAAREQQQALEESRAELQTANASLRDSRRSALNVAEDALAARRQAEETSVELRREAAERRKVEEELRQSEERFRIMGEILPYGVWWCNAQGGAEYNSQSFLDLLEMSMDQMSGFGWSRRLLPDEVEPTLKRWMHCVRTGEDWDSEHQILGPDGEYHAVLTRGRPVRDSAGGVVGWAGINLDIDERKHAEEALKKLNEELESRVAERTEQLREKDQMLLLQSRQAALGEMIGNIAHQWRQPLNVLGLTVQQLLLHYDLGKFDRTFLAESVGDAMKLIHHMSQTIDDFRNFFKPDKQKVDFKAHQAIAETLKLVEGSLQNSRIGVSIVEKDSPVIHGYPNEFAQVILNIVINARDILTEREVDDPRVTITIASEEGCAVITVADNAGGIPEEILSKIFDPYFTTKGPQTGTGIGLFMSKSIIERSMGGRITVRNVANGAEFRIEVCDGSRG